MRDLLDVPVDGRWHLRYLFEAFALDVMRRELRRGDAAVPLEPQVFDLLACLIGNRERVVSKEDLREAVWKGRVVSEATLGSRINAARAAIGDNGEDQRLIRTLPRVGFRFVGSVRESQDLALAVAPDVSVALPVPAGGQEPVVRTDQQPDPVERSESTAIQSVECGGSRPAGVARRT